MQALVRSIGFGCLALSLVACGSKGDDDDDDTGGAAGSAGSSTAGSGGSSSGAGGMSGGTSGSGGSGGMTAPPVYDFNDEAAGVDGWSVVFSNGPDDVMDAWIPKGDVMLSWAETGGVDGGALQVDIPFDAPSQWVSIGVNFTVAEDLTDKTVSVRVKLVDGIFAAEDLMTNPAGAKVYAKSGMAYVYASGVRQNIETAGNWITFTMDMANPDYVVSGATFDPAEVLEIGIQLETGSTGTGQMPGTFLIDNVSW